MEIENNYCIYQDTGFIKHLIPLINEYGGELKYNLNKLDLYLPCDFDFDCNFDFRYSAEIYRKSEIGETKGEIIDLKQLDDSEILQNIITRNSISYFFANIDFIFPRKPVENISLHKEGSFYVLNLDDYKYPIEYRNYSNAMPSWIVFGVKNKKDIGKKFDVAFGEIFDGDGSFTIE